ncbi:hypothetical protein GCM10023259_024210 [Thermocatellispora tengchongensis]
MGTQGSHVADWVRFAGRDRFPWGRPAEPFFLKDGRNRLGTTMVPDTRRNGSRRGVGGSTRHQVLHADLTAWPGHRGTLSRHGTVIAA